MNRRDFIARGAALAASSALAPGELLAQATRGNSCAGPPSGVQLFTVREALGRDPRGTLRSLKDIGIVEAELYGLSGPENATLFGLSAADLKRAFDDNGIRVPTTHIGGDLTNSAAIADIAKTLGVQGVFVALPSEFAGPGGMVPAKSRAQLDALVEKLNRAGREYRERGLTFGYHNHHVEFTKVDGIVPYDYLMSNTDPNLVKIELDLGWLATVGVDPAAYVRRYAGRVVACHLKDYNPRVATDVPQRKLVPPGSGTVDFAAVLAAMRETGVQHGFIEVDVSDDPVGDVRRGHAHLQLLKGCA